MNTRKLPRWRRKLRICLWKWEKAMVAYQRMQLEYGRNDFDF